MDDQCTFVEDKVYPQCWDFVNPCGLCDWCHPDYCGLCDLVGCRVAGGHPPPPPASVMPEEGVRVILFCLFFIRSTSSLSLGGLCLHVVRGGTMCQRDQGHCNCGGLPRPRGLWSRYGVPNYRLHHPQQRCWLLVLLRLHLLSLCRKARVLRPLVCFVQRTMQFLNKILFFLYREPGSTYYKRRKIFFWLIKHV